MREKSASDFGLAGLEYFTLRDYKRVLVNRKWLIIFVALGVAVATAAVAFWLPNIYRATTVILVDPRKVPENYVASTISATVGDRLATLRQQILSATRLGQIIDEMNLYPHLRNQRPRDVIVEMMRKSIEVQVESTTSGDRGLGAFSISYSSRDPEQAARVTNRLASLFIEENIKSREQQVIGTAEFIDRELEDARRSLGAKEEMIRQLKTKYVSELPESQGMHIQAVSSLQLELRAEMDAISRAQQQKVYLQSLLMESTPVINLDRAGPSDLLPIQAQLAQAEGQFSELRRRYGPRHPEVLKKEAEVDELRKKGEEMRRAEESGRQQLTAGTPQRRNPVIESQITALDDEIQQRNKRMSEIRDRITYHQSKLEKIPILEQQLSSILRDYEIARDHYKLLLDRKFSAEMASNLETRQKGERFVVLDPAQVPDRPHRPNRLLIDLIGLVAGIGLGLVTAIGIELVDPTVKTEREVIEQLGFPVFSEIPWLPTPREKRQKRFRTAVATLTSTVLATVFVALVWLGRA